MAAPIFIDAAAHTDRPLRRIIFIYSPDRSIAADTESDRFVIGQYISGFTGQKKIVAVHHPAGEYHPFYFRRGQGDLVPVTYGRPLIIDIPLVPFVGIDERICLIVPFSFELPVLDVQLVNIVRLDSFAQ